MLCNIYLWGFQLNVNYELNRNSQVSHSFLASVIPVSDEIEEELAPLTEALEPPPIETYYDELQKVKQAAGELSWTHILGKCYSSLERA